MLKKIAWILCIHSLIVSSCFAQQTLIPEHIDVAATRSGNHVLTFFEDSRGFIWCGTMEALVRYDGFDVKKYNYNNAPDEIIIVSITEDAKGNIWCCSQVKGLMVLPIEKYGFGTLSSPKLKTPLPKAIKIAFDGKGNLWGINQLNELFVVSATDSSLYTWPLEKTGRLTSLSFSENGNLWLSGYGGAYWVKNPVPCTEQPMQKLLGDVVRASVTEGNANYIYLKNSVLKAEDIKHTGVRVDKIAITGPMADDTLTKHYIDLTTNSLTPYLITAIFNQPLRLVNKTTGITFDYNFEGINTAKYAIQSCYYSSAGQLYIGTNKGFFRAATGNKAFKTVVDEGTKFRCVTAIGTDTLLFGTLAGGVLRFVRNNNGQWYKDKKAPRLNAKSDLANTVNRFYKDKNGCLWGVTNSGLFYENNGGWKFAFNDFCLWGITQDDAGIFWLGANAGGLVKYNPTTAGRESFWPVENAETETDKNYNRVWKTKYYKGKIYAGTAAGLLEFDPITNTFNKVFGEKFSGVPLWDFYISDTLWILPTQGRGVWLYRPQTKQFEQIETVQNYHYGLAWSGQGSFWVISDKGILVNPWPGTKPIGFNAFDGLNTDYLSFTGIASLGDSEMVVCGENGFTIADVTTALKEEGKKISQNLFISSLKYSGIPVADFLANGATVDLDYDKGQLLIEWAATHFQQNKYKLHYKLEGVDDVWNISSTDNKVNYNNLMPGTYVFDAYMTGLNDADNYKRYRLTIRINPPFWLTTWFKALLAALAAGLLFYLIYGWAVRQKLKHAQLKSEIDALRAQINPHFIFNALNSIQAYIYSESKGEANEYLVKFASLMRKILENSRQDIITLHQERTFLGLYLEMEALRFRGNLTYEISVADDFKSETFKIPSMLLQPLVENALKHGVSNENDRLHIDIKFSAQNNTLVCEVADNGKGFAQQEGDKKTSFGLKLVKERLFTLSKIYRKEYRTITGNSNANGTGAYVKLIIPQHD